MSVWGYQLTTIGASLFYDGPYLERPFLYLNGLGNDIGLHWMTVNYVPSLHIKTYFTKNTLLKSCNTTYTYAPVCNASRQNPYVCHWMPALQCRIAVSMRRTQNRKFQHELFLFSQRIHHNQMDWRCTPEGNYSELEPMSQEKWEMLGGDFPGPRDPAQSAVSSEVAMRLGSPAAIYPVRGTIFAYLAKTIPVVGLTGHPATSFWLDDIMVYSILAVSATLCPPVDQPHLWDRCSHNSR